MSGFLTVLNAQKDLQPFITSLPPSSPDSVLVFKDSSAAVGLSNTGWDWSEKNCVRKSYEMSWLVSV